jgi:hypothetical protein
MLRACLGFFGLNRSPQWTARSIRANIVEPLTKFGFDVVLFGHFNVPDIINSNWSGESNIKFVNDTKLLRMNFELSEKQSEKNISDMLSSALSVPWYRNPDKSGEIRKNMLHQLHSLRRLRDIIRGSELKFDIYILLRPDLEYIDKIKAKDFLPILKNEVDIITPNWETWEGLNDRIAICNEQASSVYLSRSELLNDFCRKSGFIHSEKFLFDVVQGSELRVAETKMRAVRVRANGKTLQEDFALSRRIVLWHKIRGRLRSM